MVKIIVIDPRRPRASSYLARMLLREVALTSRATGPRRTPGTPGAAPLRGAVAGRLRA